MRTKTSIEISFLELNDLQEASAKESTYEPRCERASNCVDFGLIQGLFYALMSYFLNPRHNYPLAGDKILMARDKL